MLATRIRSLRKEKGWTQSEFAKKVGVGRTTVCEWEVGRNSPSYERLLQIAELFEVSMNYLTGESNGKKDAANVDDVKEQLNFLIDALHNKELSVKYDGQIMTFDAKETLAAQLESTIKIIDYMNSLNK